MGPLEPLDAVARLSPETREAWSSSPLAASSAQTAANLLSDAREVTLKPGSTFYRGTHHAETEKLGLVVTGLLRTFRRSLDGRQVTLRYAPPGRLIGLPAVLGAGAGAEGQALLESRVLTLNTDRFRAVASHEPELAWKVAEHLATIVREAGDVLSAHLFLPMSSRVARCLLDTASSDGEQLVVRSSHQDLADEIGSVREVVSRTMRELTKQGYLERDGTAVVITDPGRLYSLSLGIV